VFTKYVYIRSTTVFVSSSELGLSQPLSHHSPRTRGGGGAHSPAGERLGESQFRRLEKKLSTLPTLCWCSNPARQVKVFHSPNRNVHFLSSIYYSMVLYERCPTKRQSYPGESTGCCLLPPPPITAAKAGRNNHGLITDPLPPHYDRREI
jgi:hypothetical protein